MCPFLGTIRHVCYRLLGGGTWSIDKGVPRAASTIWGRRRDKGGGAGRGGARRDGARRGGAVAVQRCVSRDLFFFFEFVFRFFSFYRLFYDSIRPIEEFKTLAEHEGPNKTVLVPFLSCTDARCVLFPGPDYPGERNNPLLARSNNRTTYTCLHTAQLPNTHTPHTPTLLHPRHRHTPTYTAKNRKDTEAAMYSVEAHTNTNAISIPASSTSGMTHLNTQSEHRQIDACNSLLRTLLILDIVILDKLHRRSNLSLLLIHLRCALDRFIDTQADGGDTAEIVRQFNSSMSLVFENARFFNLTELHEIYNALLKELHGDVDPQTAGETGPSQAQSRKVSLSVDFDSFANRILCCSESLADYKHFDAKFDEAAIMDHELEKLKSHYIATSFKYKCRHQSPAPTASSVCNENLQLVQSPDFMEFHLKRWKALNLLDRRIFKSS